MKFATRLEGKLRSSKLILVLAAAILIGGFFVVNQASAAAIPVLSVTKDATVFINDHSVGDSGRSWSNPGNASTSNNIYSTSILSKDEKSYYLKATGLNFNIPVGATIKGIEVRVEKHASVDNRISDNSVRTIKSTGISGDTKASSLDWGTTDFIATYGSPTDLWNRSWDSTTINNSATGIVFSAKHDTSRNTQTAYVDHISMTVYYIPACAPITWYRDADQDTFGNPSVTLSSCTQPSGYVSNSSDCNDGNAAIHPGATETCNNVDDNCNGQIDESLSQPAGDVGACSANTATCALGQWVDNHEITPSAETCDGVDNDCDGLVDEDLGTMPADNILGACSKNVKVCDAGSWTDSRSNYVPAAESCNNVDDNCNGAVDELLTQSAGDLGACSGNTATCALGQWIDNIDNNEVAPSAEVCDADKIDENCDGSSNEGCACNKGQTESCYAGPQGTEGVGICQSGTQTCDANGKWGLCEGAVYPATEVCNGLDDNCNGIVDEDLGTMPADNILGACSKNVKVCDAGSWTDSRSNYVPAAESCNNVDDNCNGAVDEEIDCAAPQVVSAIATAPDTVKIIFDEELQNNQEGHHPSASDFRIYHRNNTLAIGISSVAYADKIATLTLAEPLQAGDDPEYQVLTAETTIIDLAGNMVMNTISGPITDQIIPTIVLNGNASSTIEYGSAYSDPGAVCSDVFGSGLLTTAAGEVDSNTAGIYTIKYNCADAAGNAATEVSRTVVVNAKPAEAPTQAPLTSGGSSYFQPTACVSVAYDEWQACVNGIQFRNVLSQAPNYCSLTAGQQADRSRSCGATVTTGGGQVLGVKVYPVGSLLRTSDKKIYVVMSTSTVKYISSLKELKAYHGHTTFNVSYETLSQYKQVLGVKAYPDGTLLRGPDMKIYVILNGKKHHIVGLKELFKYAGKPIIDVSADVLAAY